MLCRLSTEEGGGKHVSADRIAIRRACGSPAVEASCCCSWRQSNAPTSRRFFCSSHLCVNDADFTPKGPCSLENLPVNSPDCKMTMMTPLSSDCMAALRATQKSSRHVK